MKLVFSSVFSSFCREVALFRMLRLFVGGLAFCLAVFLAADVFWRVFSPRPEALLSITRSDPTLAARDVVKRHLMGVHQEASVATNIRWRLSGLTTSAPGHPGFAILTQAGSASQGIREGEEIVPGVVLSKIFPDAVELLSGGKRQRVALLEASSVSALASSGRSAISPREFLQRPPSSRSDNVSFSGVVTRYPPDFTPSASKQ